MDDRSRRGITLLLGFAAVKLLIHFVANAWGGYGYFRDELYYIACSRHLAAGYVDQPPVSAFLLAINRLILGDSLFALRFLPAVAGAATVFLAGLMARELGGGKSAQTLAALATLLSPIYLGFNCYYSMNSFDILVWAVAAFLLIRLVKTENPRWWIVLGLVLGIGLLNKISVLWLGFGLFLGLILTPERRWLKTKWPYLCGVLAFVLFTPYILWNLQNDQATLEFMRHASGEKYSTLNAVSFLKGIVLEQNPISLPLWLSGLYFLLFDGDGRKFRILGFVWFGAFMVLLLNGHSKSEYLSAAYTMLFAAGGVAFERWMSVHPLDRIKTAYAGLIVASGIFLAPAAFPCLPVESYIRYADAIGIAPSTAEHKQLDKLPQFYADMFGWEEKAAAVAKAYHSLSAEEQRKCALFGDNYGRCAAIDFFGKKYGLPDSIGNHNNYWIWGPRGYTGEVVIILGGDLEDKQQEFRSVEIVGTVHCRYCMPYENDLRIYVCKGLKTPLPELWSQIKHYD